MKKRLQNIYWQGILVTLVMAFAASLVAAKVKMDDTRENLAAMLEASVQWTKDSNDDLQSLAESIARITPSLRVTFLLDSGQILADSRAEAVMEEHGNDREIAEARRGETGRNLRLSRNASLTLFMARRLSSQLIIRLSLPVFETVETVVMYGAGLLALFLILYLLQRRGIARLAGDQNRQFEDIRRLLDGEIDRVEAVFPEFQPSLDAISYRVRRLQEDQQEILQTLNLRNNFVANASHELRSPLTSVRGFAEMLEEGLADTPEEQAICLETIRSECDRMLAVIEDILRLSKAEGKPTGNPEVRAVRPVAQEVARSLQPQAAKKQISLELEGDVRLRAEEKDLWEILYNLMDNGIRYGREQGHVRVRMEEGQITVEDDGIGIAPEHLSHIFEQFYRVDEARSAAGGTGLGLSIVRAIAERLGGSIRAESRPGEGTRFILQFDEAEKEDTESTSDTRPEAGQENH